MNSLVFIIIMAVFFGIYALVQMKKENKVPKDEGVHRKLYQVEAGSTKRLRGNRLDMSSPIDVDLSDIKLSPDLEYFVVRNQCMTVKGISDGDIIGVRMFDEKFKLEEHNTNGQILLIHLDDANFVGYKIREQGDLTSDNNSYNTFHYKNGHKTQSSRPHSIESIKAIVVEVYEKEYVGIAG